MFINMLFEIQVLNKFNIEEKLYRGYTNCYTYFTVIIISCRVLVLV